ncbi:MAG: hypothetical protein AAFX53_03620 [Bacteroidota bacterium]
MKKITFLAVVFTIGISYGQQNQNNEVLILEKGRWFLGGNASLDITSAENENDAGTGENDRWSVDLNGKTGHFFANNLLVGLGIGYGHTNSENTNRDMGNQTDTTGFNIQDLSLYPFIRGYKSIVKKIALFLEGEARYSRIWRNNTLDNRTTSESTINQVFIGLRPGFTYFATTNLAFEANLGVMGYSYNDGESESFNTNGPNPMGQSQSSSFTLSLNPSNLFFGLAYYF